MAGLGLHDSSGLLLGAAGAGGLLLGAAGAGGLLPGASIRCPTPGTREPAGKVPELLVACLPLGCVPELLAVGL